MKLLIAACMLSIAFVPMAAASGGASANVFSGGSGDCATAASASQQNTASAGASATGVGSASASGGTTCSAFRDFFTGQIVRSSRIFAGASACTAATGCVGASAVWLTQGSFCSTTVSATGAGSNNLGCPLGPTPYVNALIP